MAYGYRATISPKKKRKACINKKRKLRHTRNKYESQDTTLQDQNLLIHSYDVADIVSRKYTNVSRNQLVSNAEYMDILVGLLSEPYNIDSLSKIVFIAFCVQYNDGTKIYSNRKKNLIQIFMNALSIKLLSHISDLQVILEQIYILDSSGWILISDDGKIHVKSAADFNQLHSGNEFLNHFIGKKNNPIIAVNKLEDKAFLEEVIRYF